MDEYVYTGDDDVLRRRKINEGEVFEEKDFNKKLICGKRKKELVLDSINQEKLWYSAQVSLMLEW